jgi:hypothetical protein
MPLPVIPALFKEMAHQRKTKNKTLGEVATAVKRSKRTIERWEKTRSLPLKQNDEDPGGDVARAVDGYSKVLEDTTPFDLWSAALERAKKERRNYERSLARKAREAPKSRAKQVSKPTDQRRDP